jgi:hypothetical protein
MTRWSSFASRRWLVGLVGGLLVVALGIGAYFIGLSSGEDLEQARATGAAVGERQGAATGRKAGFRHGFRGGLEATFDAAYAEAFRRAYQAQFENADLKPPDRIEVPATEPPR